MSATIERHKSGKIHYVTEVSDRGEVLRFGEPGVSFTKDQCEKVAAFNDGRLNIGELRIVRDGKVLKSVKGSEPPAPPKQPEVTTATLKEQVAHLEAENHRLKDNQPKIAKLQDELAKVKRHYDELAALITDEEDGAASHDEVLKLLTDILAETETTGDQAAEMERLREENVKLAADLKAYEDLAKEGSTAGE